MRVLTIWDEEDLPSTMKEGIKADDHEGNMRGMDVTMVYLP
jgi:hypothetical protein